MQPIGDGDDIRNHPKLEHLDLPPLGGEGRGGPLLTRTLLIHAQDTPEGTAYSLERAIAAGLSNNPDLRAARLELDALEGHLGQRLPPPAAEAAGAVGDGHPRHAADVAVGEGAQDQPVQRPVDDAHALQVARADDQVVAAVGLLKVNPKPTRSEVAEALSGRGTGTRFAASGSAPAFKLWLRHGKRIAGRIHVGPEIDYLERAFDASKYGEFSSEPYLDINIPSIGDPSLAPAGQHVMSIHVQFAPYKLKQGDWTTRSEEFADKVIGQLQAYAPGLRDLIVAGQVITPLDLEQTYGLSGGHIHHGEQTIDQFFTFRPLIGWAQYRTPLKRLYLCGAGTHPGNGMTGLSGFNASREILKDLR